MNDALITLWTQLEWNFAYRRIKSPQIRVLSQNCLFRTCQITMSELEGTMTQLKLLRFDSYNSKSNIESAFDW